MEIRRSEPGDDHPDFAQSVHGLAMVYQAMGRWLKGVYPVSTGLVVSALARPEWLVEIDATAGSGRRGPERGRTPLSRGGDRPRSSSQGAESHASAGSTTDA